MAKSFAGLKADALVIKNEVEESKNTATRIGTMFSDVVEKMENVESAAVEQANAQFVGNIVNNLTDGGADKALSAEMGKELTKTTGYSIVKGEYSAWKEINLTDVILTGDTVFNQGVKIRLASDKNQTYKKDLESGDSWVCEFDVTFVKVYDVGGQVLLYRIGSLLVGTDNILPKSIPLSKLNDEVISIIDDAYVGKKIGINMLDTNTLTEDKLISSDGSIKSGTGYYISDYIEILPNAQYILSKDGGIYPGGSGYYALYDKNKKFLSADNNKIIETTADTGFIRVTLFGSNIATSMLNTGNIRLDYIPYSAIGGYNTDKGLMAYNMINRYRVKAGSFGDVVNLFDVRTVSYGDVRNNNTDVNYRSSDYIKVNPTSTYYASNVRRIYTYDAGHNYISMIDRPTSVVFDPAVKYVILLINNYNIDSAMFTVGSLPTQYIPHEVDVPFIKKNVYVNNFRNITPSVNLLSNYEYENGYINNGKLNSSSSYYASLYIKVTPATDYSFAFCRFVDQYDDNFAFIDGLHTDLANADKSSITMDSVCRYIRVTVSVSKMYKAMVVKGELPSEYKDFRIKVPFILPYRSKYEGKRMVCFGDSITGSVEERDISNWCMYLEEATGIKTVNQGYWSARVAYSDDSSDVVNAFAFYRLIDALLTQDFSGQDIIYNTAGYEKHAKQLDKLKTIDLSTIDIISISLGTNDLSSKTPFEIEDEPLSVNSVNGAMRYSISRLLTAYPHLRIIITTPIYRFTGSLTEGNDYIIDGRGIKDFVDDYINLGRELHIPVIDLYSEIPVNRYNKDYYFGENGGDGLHPNYKMKELMGAKIAGGIISLL